jgi:hypothetical protein
VGLVHLRKTADVDLSLLAVSAGAGALASVATATIIARAGERGRIQEAARQRLLAAVRLYRSQVAMERGNDFRPATEPNYLGPTERQSFAETVEAELLSASKLLRWRVRLPLEKLTGPLDARTARWSSPLPVSTRETKARVVYFLERVAEEGLSDAQIDDHGLIGRAHNARASDDAKATLDAAVAELKKLERVVLRWRW